MLADGGKMLERRATKSSSYRNVSSLKQAVFLQSLPHFALAIASLSYIFLTAVVFQQLDETHHSNSTVNFTVESELKRTQSRFIAQLRSLRQHDRFHYISEGQKLLDSLVDQVEIIRKTEKIQTSQGRGLGKFIMFSATTLTSIGYGNDSPRTTNGRLFCILVCLIGIPLIIITVADLAKFLSHWVLQIYLKWRHFSHRLWLKRLKPSWDGFLGRRQTANITTPTTSSHSDTTEETIDLRVLSDEEVADFLWTFLESAEFVEVPTLWALALVLLYAAIGAVFLQISEDWGYFESFYCATLSILTVGFGDLAPTNPNWVAIAVLYVSFGSVITTMCIDAVAYRYIRQVHNVQRRIKLNDDLEWLKAVQNARMRKDALRALFTALAFLPTRDINQFTRPIVEKQLEEPKRKPNAPKNLHVDYVNAYSVSLHWSYDDPVDDVQFVLAYKPKHLRTATPTVIDNIRSLEVEVKELKSFTLYEFMLTADSERDRSDSVHLLQYTEPETVPQNLKVELLEESEAVRLTWDPPCKNKVEERAYHVYYTDTPELPFEKWNRLPMRTSCVAVIEGLDLSLAYHFCVSAIHNSGVAVLSRVVMSLAWSNTPDHLLLKIFAYVPQRTLYTSVSCVNRHWGSLATHKSLWKSVDLNIDDLYIRRQAVRTILYRFGPGLESLRFRVGANLQPAIITVIPQLPCLKELEFYYEKEFKPTTLPFVISRCLNVETARFGRCKELANIDLTAMANGWSNLHKICVTKCPKITMEGMTDLFKTAKDLVMVDFEGIDTAELDTTELDDEPCIKSDLLSLMVCKEHGSSLKSVGFNGQDCLFLVIEAMERFSPHLEELSITCATADVFSFQLQGLIDLLHLHLDFNRSAVWNEHQGMTFSDVSHMSNLRCVSINPSAAMDVLPSFTIGCPLLQSFTYGRLPPTMLESICENLRQLEILRLFNTDGLDLEVLNLVPHKNLPMLRYLELKGTESNDQASVIEDLLNRTVGLFVCLMSSGSANLRQNLGGVIVAKSERERVEFLRSISLPCCKHYSYRNAFDYFQY